MSMNRVKVCGDACFVYTRNRMMSKRTDIDVVDCPVCKGTGRKTHPADPGGFFGDLCSYCVGDGWVGRAFADRLVEDGIALRRAADETDAPEG